MFKSGMAGMLQKAQKIQADMQKAKEDIKRLTATGRAAGGAVQITINGVHQASAIQIDTALMNDKDLLEDLILTAINDANKQIRDISAAKIKNATGDIKLPDALNLSF